MIVRFVSQDTEWTESMKLSVASKIVEPLKRHLNHESLELAVHLESQRHANFAMWLVLQMPDQPGNLVVRRQGDDFDAVAREVSVFMRAQMRGSKRLH